MKAMTLHTLRFAAAAAMAAMLLVVSACSKSTDHELRDKWKLERYSLADGRTMEVDSVFFNFMKGSASVIYACGSTPYYTMYGAYRLWADSMEVELHAETDAARRAEYFDRYLGWGDDFKQRFRIRTLTSSTLELERGDTIMHMTKH